MVEQKGSGMIRAVMETFSDRRNIMMRTAVLFDGMLDVCFLGVLALASEWLQRGDS